MSDYYFKLVCKTHTVLVAKFYLAKKLALEMGNACKPQGHKAQETNQKKGNVTRKLEVSSET